MENSIGLEVNGLVKKFENVIALKEVNLKISKGKVIGLLGQNGAGKSTLIRLLSGVMRPTDGNAIVYGFDLISQTTEVKRITGLLPEEYALYEKLTVYEYTQFIATLYDIDEGDFTKRFQYYSKLLELNDLKHRLIETLSKGQKQKAAIITALIHEPRVLFLDEPLANLDVRAQKVVRKLILDYKNQDRIILIATHLLRNVAEVCDDIILINKGVIRYNGSLSKFNSYGEDLEEAYLHYLEEVE